jgi:hypothetical protein
MAADWIKMRMNLQSHPKVVRIMSAICPQNVQTKTDKFRVIGGLHAVWCIFDTHSIDGVLHGYTPFALDHVIGWDGFSDALIAVGWLQHIGDESLVMPEFEEHNGESAKRRAEDSKNKRIRRMSAKCPQNVRENSGQNAEDLRTREEKRREDINTIEPKGSLSDSTESNLPKQKRNVIPYEKIVSLYHEHLPKCPKVEILTAKRKSQIGARWNSGELDTLESWEGFFKHCAHSRFLMGAIDPAPGRNRFVADLEWLTKESNYTKIVEGKYHG